MLPSAASTRWQGTSGANGFERIALPIARAHVLDDTVDVFDGQAFGGEVVEV